MTRFRIWLPWLLLAASAVMMILGRVIDFGLLEQGSGGGVVLSELATEVAMTLAFLSFPVVGALIAARQPDNSVGWLLLVVGVLAGMGILSMSWSEFALGNRNTAFGGTLAGWISAWFWYPLIMTIPTFLLLLFPTGHLPSRRWRPLAWIAAGQMLVIAIAAMLQEWLIGDDYRVRNPIGIIPGDVEERLGVLFVSFIPVMLLCLISLVVRFVRGRGRERDQLKWVALAALVLLSGMMLGDVVRLPEFLFPLALITFPASIGVAILKYRLYEIDVIINRALVYGVLTAFIVAAYAGGVLVFRTALDPVTGDNDIAIAASTLAVAALFGPARRGIQAFIDRRFYRSRYDAQQTLEGFAARVRDEVDLDALSIDLLRVVSETVQPRHASLWLVHDGAR